MAKKPFFPTGFPEQLTWFEEFLDTLKGPGGYAAKYNIDPTETAALTGDLDYLKYWTDTHNHLETLGQNVTAFRNELVMGPGTPVSLPPDLSPPAAAPAAVLPGIYPRVLAVAKRIKNHALYTITDGEALKLEGVDLTPVDVANLKPILKLEVSGGKVTVKWKKERTQGVEIWVRRNGGDWVFLVFDTVPDHMDTMEFPANTETWEYKAYYHYAGVRAGNWSDVVSVQVKA